MNNVQILELGRVFCGTPKGELPYLRLFRLEGSALIYMGTNHLVNGSLGPLTITGWAEGYGCQEPPQACQGVSQNEGQVAKSPDELLKWIKDLNSGLHTEHWKVLERQPEPKAKYLFSL
jgi:hypothetical protein